MFSYSFISFIYFIRLFCFILFLFFYFFIIVRRPPSAVRHPPSAIRHPPSLSAVRIRTLQSPISDSVNLHTIPIVLHQSFTKNCTKVKNKPRNHKSRRRYRFKVAKVKISYGKNCESRKPKKTITETFDRIKFKQNPDKIVPNIS